MRVKISNRINIFQSLRVCAWILLLCISVSGVAAPDKTASGKKKGATTAVKTTKSTNKSKGKRGTKQGTSKNKKGKGSAGSAKESVSDVRKREAAAQQEIARTREQIRENEAAVKKSLLDLGRLQNDIDAGEKRLTAARAEVKSLETQIGKLESDIASNEAELTRLRDEYLKAVKKIRIKKKTSSNLAFIFSSKNFSEAMRRMRYLKQFSDWRSGKSKEIEGIVTGLKQKREVLAVARDRQAAAEKRETAAYNDLQKQYKAQDAVVVKLKANGAALQAHLAKKQSEVNELKNRVAALIAEEQRRAAAEQRAREEAERKAKLEAERQRLEAEARQREEEAKKKAEMQASATEKNKEKKPKEEKPKKQKEPKKDKKPKEEKKSGTTAETKSYAEVRKRKPRDEAAAATASVGNFASMKGSLPNPVSGTFRITSRFGRHALPDLPDVMYDNPGIDAETTAGASAQAVYGGQVSGVYMIPGFSTVVIVNHGNYYTVYGNILKAAVKVGDNVKTGQSLGKLAADEDDTSRSSIHFEVWHNREKLNPSEWLR